MKVHKNSSKKIIKDAYISQVKKYHPDLFQNDGEKKWAEAKMKEINAAYEILSDDIKRLEYDKSIENEKNYYPHSTKNNPSTVDYERLISFMMASFNCLVYLLFNSSSFVYTLMFMIFITSCIWFSESMSSYTGVFITTTSSSIFVKILSWMILGAYTIFCFLILVGILTY